MHRHAKLLANSSLRIYLLVQKYYLISVKLCCPWHFILFFCRFHNWYLLRKCLKTQFKFGSFPFVCNVGHNGELSLGLGAFFMVEWFICVKWLNKKHSCVLLTIARDHFKHYKKIWLLGSKILKNEGSLNTFAKCSICHVTQGFEGYLWTKQD